MSHDPGTKYDSDDKKNTSNKSNSSSKSSLNGHKNVPISGDKLVEIVRKLGVADLNDTVRQSGKTIEMWLRNTSKIFNNLARINKLELLTKQGLKCGLDEMIATALAVELMDEYPKQQSNGMQNISFFF